MPVIDSDAAGATYTQNLECPITKIWLDKQEGKSPLEGLRFSKTEGDNMPLSKLLISDDTPCLNPKRTSFKDTVAYPTEIDKKFMGCDYTGRDTRFTKIDGFEITEA